MSANVPKAGAVVGFKSGRGGGMLVRVDDDDYDGGNSGWFGGKDVGALTAYALE